jgi:DNA-binding NtrC family response regulator
LLTPAALPLLNFHLQRSWRAVWFSAFLRREQMPARIVVVHDDRDFREGALTALAAAGYDIAVFTGSMEAIGAFQVAERIELLITRVVFPEGTPNGVSLARMAKVKKPGIRILVSARDENREHTEGVGEFLPVPVTGPEIVAAVKRMLVEETA